MLVWFDLASSRKERPNENFARELMELFTLGEGNYTEDDIKESAKAFHTGYRINQVDQQFRFVPNQFDPSIKVFMKMAGSVERRSNHRHHFGAASMCQIHRRQGLAVFCV